MVTLLYDHEITKKLAESMFYATFKLLHGRNFEERIEMKVRAAIQMTGFLFSLILLPGCFGESKEKDSGLKVINVLEEKFYDDAHIPGSIQIPIMEVEERAKAWPKDTKIVVYCSNYTCSASGTIARKLKDNLKFENVYAYEAGMAGWKQAGLPVEGPAKEGYLDMPNERLSDRKHTDVQEISTEELKKLLDEVKP